MPAKFSNWRSRIAIGILLGAGAELVTQYCNFWLDRVLLRFLKLRSRYWYDFNSKCIIQRGLCIYCTALPEVLQDMVSVSKVLFCLFSFQPCFVIFVKSCLFRKSLCDFFFNMEDFIKRIIQQEICCK